MNFLSKLRPWILPLAMAGGLVFHSVMEDVEFLAPYLIFVMLVVTFCKLDFSRIRITRGLMALLGCQLIGSCAVYLLLKPVSEVLAQGAFICIFCPTATAAPVVTSMLGGDLMKVVTFSLMSNISVALLSPVLFTMMTSSDISFLEEVAQIAVKVVPLVILPMITAIVIKKVAPKVHNILVNHQGLSFYVWAVSLFIVVGRSVSFVLTEPPTMIPTMILLGVISLIACVAQFWVGRKIGEKFGDKISYAQSLGQKNTVLAIWMALTYLNPVTSVASAAYIAWQNTINSLQLFFKARRDAEKNC